MSSSLTRTLTAAFLTVALSLTASVQANTVEEKPTALSMTGDAIFARPALLAMTAVGGAVYLASLPFSLIGGNAGEAGDVLFLEPAKATFVRCLGCTMAGRHDGTLVEQNSD
ncbi:hypothetical protein [Hydrocarboniclastica marina]|uniref:Multidrug transporter n=1 Tax=Hydrocarboniclastica marina TaxID=2259620 RepID=A0A4P7XD44_9ALTE|nr:hypothetical protein [Hydrocarboniclastica marina]MAL98829.1 hypothetical protein [Alteromonadaceae bacterium]QCF24706.1 hypothetical protein soil367_01350 [Hydrocarboniclastica marina]|tara:strand:+ start:203 stop:538 length:336 start_codon:yes stop_codon:yes gene_type:complete